MAGLAIKELEKRNNALLVWNKINKKDGKDSIFELNGGEEVNLQFNPNVKGIDKVFNAQDIEEITLLSKPKSTKMFFVDSKNKEYKLTDLKKTEEFGGGGGSGGGADDTAVTESMQCYYSALRYKLGNDLNNKNATPAKLKDKSLQDKVFAYPKAGATRFTAGDLLAIHSSGKSKGLDKLGLGSILDIHISPGFHLSSLNPDRGAFLTVCFLSKASACFLESYIAAIKGEPL